ncbi:LuxR C-terminal-related transcriptional regulator [Pseudonocardia nantongensis]|uniref:helix-turn-helix transcriptional regulator n=1 Tax=Pseudonocardia nantongensis TaxID=1181885 RepID=UPI00397B5DB3
MVADPDEAGTGGLAGRADELAAVRSLLAGPGPGTVLLTGPAGIGTTALADAVAAGHDGPVHRARGASWEAGRAGGVLAQLTGSTPARWDGGPGGSEPVASAAAVDAADPFAAAGRLAAACPPGTRTLHVVDDAHEADPWSLQVLSTLVRHHPDTPVAVLLVGRPAAATPEVADLLRRAGAEVAVRPLNARAAGTIAATRGVPLGATAADRLARHTAGRPRHVIAVLDALPADAWSDPHVRLPAPPEIATAVRAARAGLSGPALALLDIVAVLDRPGEPDEIAAVTGAAPRDVLGGLAEAARAGLIAPAGSRWGPAAAPADPMVRAAVLDELGPDVVADLRARAGAVVEDPTRRLTLLAGAASGRDAALATELDDRAAVEAREGAWSTVAGLLTESSRLTPDRRLREERLVRAVDALVGSGECRTAEAMIPVVEATRDTPLRGAVLGYLAVLLGRSGEAAGRLSRAWELAGGPDGTAARDPAGAAVVAHRRVLHALARGRGDELVTWADRAIAIAEPDAPAAVESAAIRGLGLAARGRAAEGRQAYEAVADQVHRGAQVQRIAMGRGWLSLVQDELGAARADLESAVPTTELGGSSRISLWALGWLARTRFLAGDWDGALQAVEQGRELAARTGIALLVPLVEWTAAQVHALRDERAPAERAARDAEAVASDYEVVRVPGLLARAHLAEARTDYPAVLRALEPLATAGGTVDEPGWWPWTDVYANALVMVGDPDAADAFLRPHEERAAQRGHRSTLARLGYARGRVLGSLGDHAGAWAAFDSALARIDRLPHRYDRARVRFAYGQTLRRAGKRRDADGMITEARELFDGLGAVAYVRRCDRELKAGGVHAGGRPERAATELTPQERAVAELVVRGVTNREAAAELQVSVKTVQYHLTRIYAKVGVRSRAELAGRLSSSGG